MGTLQRVAHYDPTVNLLYLTLILLEKRLFGVKRMGRHHLSSLQIFD
jgi:hypothetical protein